MQSNISNIQSMTRQTREYCKRKVNKFVLFSALTSWDVDIHFGQNPKINKQLKLLDLIEIINYVLFIYSVKKTSIWVCVFYYGSTIFLYFENYGYNWIS